MIRTAAIDSNNVENILNLSPIQKGILYHYLGKPYSKAYLAQLTLYINGKVNIGLMKKAYSFVTRNNEMLRAVFRWEGLSNPVQIILKDYEIPFHIIDYSNECDSEGHAKLLKEKIWSRGINISEHPVEITICKVSDCSFQMFICWHHIIYDGWSNAIFLREVLTAYENLLRGIPLESERKRKYKDFIMLCRSRDERQQENYWNTYFKDFVIKPHLPVDTKKKTGIITESGFYNFSLPEDMLIRVSDFTKKKGITISVLMYCAWSILLYKYSRVNDLVFGVTVSGRNIDVEGIENTIGLFINTLPLRVIIDDETRIYDILEDINRRKDSWVPYESTDLSKIKTCSRIDANKTLFDSIVVIENYPLKLNQWMSRNGKDFIIDSFDMCEKTEFSLVLGVFLPHNNILTLQYDTEQFTSEFIKKMAEYYLNIINTVMTDFDKKVSVVDLLLEKEKEKMLLEYKKMQDTLDISFDF